MTITTVIWDVGGVLARTEDGSPRQQLADRFKLNRNELEEVVFGGVSGGKAQLGQISTEEHWKNVLQLLSLEEKEHEEFQRLFWAGDRIDFELIDYIRSLRKRYQTGLLSNAFLDLRKILTSTWKIADAFDQMVISAEVGLVKPDPAIYRMTLDRLEVEAGQAVFIDDMAVNVEAARQVGMHAIQFMQPEQARLELERLLNGNGT